MRHRDLEVDNIRKLVGESTNVARTDDLIASFLSKVDRIVEDRFYSKRRLDGGQLSGIWKDCLETVKRDIAVIDGVFTEVPATRTRPKGEIYEMRFVSFMKMKDGPVDHRDVYQLFSFRLRLSRRSVDMDFEAHPVGFTYHAAERVLERGKDIEAAMLRTATELARSLELIACAESHAIEHCRSLFNVPFEDASGALLGEFVAAAPDINRSTEFRKGVVWDVEANRNHQRFFLARTFVDRYLLEPAQAYGMNLLDLWKNEAGEPYRISNARRCMTHGEGLAEYDYLMGDGDIKSLIGLVFADADVRRGMLRHYGEGGVNGTDALLPCGRWYEPHVFLELPEAA